MVVGAPRVPGRAGSAPVRRKASASNPTGCLACARQKTTSLPVCPLGASRAERHDAPDAGGDDAYARVVVEWPAW
jgi:hypothetical protein